MDPRNVTSELIFFVNGKKIIDSSVDPETTLLLYLRKKLFLKGSKEGCSEGGCGVCTVMLSKYDRTTGQIEHFTVNACLTLVASLHGVAVTTVEGIGSIESGLHPVQERMAIAHGTQCGFCSPGFVMSMYALLRNNPQPSMEEIEENISGNLCRCTGYRPILEGFRTFCGTPVKGDAAACPAKEDCCQFKGDKMEGEDYLQTQITFNTEHFKPYDQSQDIIFPPELKLSCLDEHDLYFKGKRVEFHRPVSLSRLLQLKALYPEACLLSGNTEIGVQVKFMNGFYPVIIDISKVDELKKVVLRGTHLKIGATATLSRVENFLKNQIGVPNQPGTTLSALLETFQRFGSKQIRNVATFGGNLMSGSPISDLIPLLMASDSTLVLKSKGQ